MLEFVNNGPWALPAFAFMWFMLGATIRPLCDRFAEWLVKKYVTRKDRCSRRRDPECVLQEDSE